MAKNKVTKAQKEELARFFEYCYRRAHELDPRELPDSHDLPRILLSIAGSARTGYFDVTGEWLPSKRSST